LLRHAAPLEGTLAQQLGERHNYGAIVSDELAVIARQSQEGTHRARHQPAQNLVLVHGNHDH
jgi:hypothetical protein